jgi:hypothetical protein
MKIFEINYERWRIKTVYKQLKNNLQNHSSKFHFLKLIKNKSYISI